MFLAMAAIAVLSSCTKTEIIHTGQQQEIGFKMVESVMTKASLSTEVNMGVFSHVSHDKLYFRNAEFESKTGTGYGGKWAGTTARYWPLSGNLDFMVYAPYQATGVEVSPTSTKSTMTITFADNSTNQYELLYGEQYYVNTSKQESVSVNLKHALCKVTVEIMASAEDLVTVKNVKLAGTKQSGTATVTYADRTSNEGANVGSVAWTNLGTDKELSVVGDTEPGTELTTTATTATTAYILSVPTTPGALTFQYKLANSENYLEYTITSATLGSWDAGMHYTYTITITPAEILFTPTCTEMGNSSKDVPVPPTA